MGGVKCRNQHVFRDAEIEAELSVEKLALRRKAQLHAMFSRWRTDGGGSVSELLDLEYELGRWG